MYSFPIPVVGLGPGSQPVEEVLDTLGLPSDMATYRPPINDSEAPEAVYREALAFLRQVLAAMEAGSCVRSCRDLAPAVLAEVNEMLGQGEVSVQALRQGLSAQETAFTGLWRVRGVGVDLVEAGHFPRLLAQVAQGRLAPEDPVPIPAGLMNAPALLAEIRERSARCRPGDEAQVINLSLLPVTPEDLAFLDEALGRAEVSILSRGFGNCRITATAYPHVWWVQYFNAMEKLILNSVEIVDLPAVALAAEEDCRDSRLRLAEWLESLESAR